MHYPWEQRHPRNKTDFLVPQHCLAGTSNRNHTPSIEKKLSGSVGLETYEFSTIKTQSFPRRLLSGRVKQNTLRAGVKLWGEADKSARRVA